MTKKIDQGLFARLMRLSAPARNDLLEYIGQAPSLTESLVESAETAGRKDASATKPDQ